MSDSSEYTVVFSLPNDFHNDLSINDTSGNIWLNFFDEDTKMYRDKGLLLPSVLGQTNLGLNPPCELDLLERELSKTKLELIAKSDLTEEDLYKIYGGD